GSLGLVLAQQTASACVPAPLTTSTVKAATLVAAGQALTAGVISAEVVALTAGGLNAMFPNKWKGALVFPLAGGVAVTGAGIWTHPVLAQKPAPPERKEKPAQPSKGGPVEVTGVLQSLDVAGGQITLGGKPGPQTFGLAREVKVIL